MISIVFLDQRYITARLMFYEFDAKLVFFFEGPICETHKLAQKIGERDHPIFKALTKLNEGNRTCEADSLDA